jgi:predicted nucleic acid-binding protein
LIGEFDIIIAAIARKNHEPLFSLDKHFQFVEGLHLVKF